MKFIYTFVFLSTSSISAQSFLQQYFDGGDTIPGESMFIEIDTTSANINVWQIGPPQKTLFNAASTAPNVLITDTLNFLPDSVISSFKFSIDIPSLMGEYWGIQWAQKLHLEWEKEIGIIEYSTDTGSIWINVFDDPEVYDFFGWSSANFGYYHLTGESGFTGNDLSWQDVWLCFDYDFLDALDTLEFRFTVKSDSVEHASEGWMIDNFSVHPTWTHIIQNNSAESAFKIYPSVTTGPLEVICKKTLIPIEVTQVEVIDVSGNSMQTFVPSSSSFKMDLGGLANGRYVIRIRTTTGFDAHHILLMD